MTLENSAHENVPALRTRRVADRRPRYTLSDPAARALVSAMELLNFRSSGPAAWVSPFRENPIAFLLDSMADAVTVKDEHGAVVFRNRAGMELQLTGCESESLTVIIVAGQRFERRRIRFSAGRDTFVMEILHSDDKAVGPKAPGS